MGGFRASFLLLPLVFAACATAPRFHGPMKVRNQHPAQLTVLHMDPRPATAAPAGGFRLDATQAYTSLFLAGSNDATGASIRLDGEVWRSAVALRGGVGGGVDVAVELPFVHASGGFLDSFVIDWHDVFGFPDQGRQRAPRGDFDIGAATGGRTVWQMDEVGFAIADVPIEIAFLPVEAGVDGSPFGLGARAAVELPTGDDDRGLGSGGLDAAVGLFGEYRTGPLSFTGQAQHTFAATPGQSDDVGFRFRDVTSLGAGVECAVTNDFWLVVQTEWETSTLRAARLERASDPQWLLWTGLRYGLADGARLEIGLGEDLSPFIAPDFTAWVALSFDFGPRPGH